MAGHDDLLIGQRRSGQRFLRGSFERRGQGRLWKVAASAYGIRQSRLEGQRATAMIRTIRIETTTEMQNAVASNPALL